MAGKLDPAAVDFSRAIAIDQKHWQSWLELGKIRLAQGRQADAARMVAEARRRAPSAGKQRIDGWIKSLGG